MMDDMMELKMANVFLNAKMKLFCNGLGIVKFGGEMMVDMMSGGDENWWVGNGLSELCPTAEHC